MRRKNSGKLAIYTVPVYTNSSFDAFEGMDVRDLMFDLMSKRSGLDLQEICAGIATAFGFKHYFYVEAASARNSPALRVVNGFPDIWWDSHRVGIDLMSEPLFKPCLTRTKPMEWTELDGMYPPHSPHHRRLREARASGLVSGICFPLHRPGGGISIFALASDLPAESMQEKFVRLLPVGLFFCAYIHEALDNGAADPKSTDDDEFGSLSKREHQCLQWAAEGKTSSDTALILHISEATVVYHLQNAVRKLGASNRLHAVVKAIAMGILRA